MASARPKAATTFKVAECAACGEAIRSALAPTPWLHVRDGKATCSPTPLRPILEPVAAFVSGIIA